MNRCHCAARQIAKVQRTQLTRGVGARWYENGCACGERRELVQNYQGDVRLLDQLGFDGVKLDGCGAQRNMTAREIC